MGYEVDLRDIRFQLFEWLETDKILQAERFSDWDAESLDSVLQEALKIAQEQMAPANEEGDREGARLEDGTVKVPESFTAAYRTLAEGGWVGCVNNPDFGGMGMPQVAATAASELFNGANLGLSVVLMLTHGAGELIEHFGSPELKRLFCERLYTGEWTGTMCLTEPQAGSDVGATTTRAERQEDGTYRISGEKIFITYGDHDMTANVVHMVLARVPDAPAGTKGLSLFVVPKVRVDGEGALGEANDVQSAGIEHKLGINGSPTCSLLFGANGDCRGYLLGEENTGMRLMFHMMNLARLEVGLEGLALAGAAHQAALGFARERVQGRHWLQLADKSAPNVSIVEHPDVRRMLATSSAYVQAMRALLFETSFHVDMAAARRGDERAEHRALVELLTPVCKAWASDWGFRVTEWCLQVFGGYGYSKDYPAEQYLRDAKITSIYEGTNGIQALDLVMRKLRAHDGRPLRQLLERVEGVARELQNDPHLAGAAAQLDEAVGELGEVLSGVSGSSDTFLLLMLNAVPILDMLGHTLAGGLLMEQAMIARDRLAEIVAERSGDAGDENAHAELLDGNREAAFYHNKVCSAVLFAYRALPLVKALGTAVRAEERTPIEFVM
jgi:alkylation response protein AidB-like acyl-CoA dehydrogenase